MFLPGDHAWRDLSEANLAGQTLDRSDFTGAVLRRVDFWGASLRGCRFCFADLEDADLGLAHLDGADFTGAWLGGATVAASNDLYAPGAFFGGREHWEPMRDLVRRLLQGAMGSAEAAAEAAAFAAAEPMELVAELLMDQGQRDLARGLLQRAYDLGKTVNAARFLSRLLPAADAIALLQDVEIAADDPQYPGLAGDLGTLLMRTGNHRQARPLLFRAVSADVPDPGPFFAAAAFDLSEGRVHEAQKLLEVAVLRGPSVPEYRLALAGLLHQQDDRAGATEHLAAIVRQRRAAPDTWITAALLLLKVGRPDLALDLTERAPAWPPEVLGRRRRVRLEAQCCLGLAPDGPVAGPWESSRVLWAGGAHEAARAAAREGPPSLELVDWLEHMGDDQGALAMLIDSDARGADRTGRLVPLTRRAAPERLEAFLAELYDRPGGTALAGLLHRAERLSAPKASATLRQFAGEVGQLWSHLPAEIEPTAPPVPLLPVGFSVCGRDPTGPLLALDSPHIRPRGAAEWVLDPSGERVHRWRHPAGAPAPVDRPTDPADLHVVIGAITPVGRHPFLGPGIAATLQALLPGDASPALRERIPVLLQALKAHHGLDDAALAGLPRGPVVDGFSPNLLVRVGDQIRVLPELPPVLLGPARWNEAQWIASARVDWQALLVEGCLRSTPLHPDEQALLREDPRFEGLVLLALTFIQFAMLDFVVPLPRVHAHRLMDLLMRRAPPLGG